MSTDATAQAQAAMDAAETEARRVMTPSTWDIFIRRFPSARDLRWARDRLALIAADREQLTRHAPVGAFHLWCTHCNDRNGRALPWPCEDAATITRRWNGDNT